MFSGVGLQQMERLWSYFCRSEGRNNASEKKERERHPGRKTPTTMETLKFLNLVLIIFDMF